MSVKIGQVIDDFEVIKYLGKTKNHMKQYVVRCIKCGKTKQTQLSKLHSHIATKHSNKYCGIYLEEYDQYLGKTVEDYTLIKYLRSDNGEYRYIMKCNVCGTEYETYLNNFFRKYGTSHKKCSRHIPKDKYINRFKKIYSCMRYRTCNPNYTEYYYYGGRGINSDYFKDFMVFYKEMYESYKTHVDIYGEKNTSLDRINPDGNYDTSNCRWATNKEQANNTRIRRKCQTTIPKGSSL